MIETKSMVPTSLEEGHQKAPVLLSGSSLANLFVSLLSKMGSIRQKLVQGDYKGLVTARWRQDLISKQGEGVGGLGVGDLKIAESRYGIGGITIMSLALGWGLTYHHIHGHAGISHAWWKRCSE